MLGIFQKGFSRGDHKEPDRRCPIAAKIIAGMLETAGTNQVLIKRHVDTFCGTAKQAFT
jgi:hypothetical protein